MANLDDRVHRLNENLEVNALQSHCSATHYKAVSLIAGSCLGSQVDIY